MACHVASWPAFRTCVRRGPDLAIREVSRFREPYRALLAVAFHDIAGRLARRFLKHFREELARSRRAADVQAVHAVLDAAEIAFPTEIAQHEPKALEFR